MKKTALIMAGGKGKDSGQEAELTFLSSFYH